ncbi:MAG TPA: cysteine hydrolase family protein [Candidatus Cybelea sp.]|nr:cysteine hydrolase family protein [Candidatus Cybelea sp.]
MTSPHMPSPKTLLDFAGAGWPPARLEDAVLLVIDHQREYTEGKLPLDGIDAAVAAIARLQQAVREAGAPIIHVAQNGRPGGALFDPDGPMVAFIDGTAPVCGETVVKKSLPNAFAHTVLDARLKAIGRTDLIIAGFMAHMCVSATSRSALDHGYRVTIAADATATRDLPDGWGGAMPAATVKRVALAELGDRFARVVSSLVPVQNALRPRGVTMV